MRLISSLSPVSGRTHSSPRRKPFRINLTRNEPTRAKQTNAPEPTFDRMTGDGIGDVQPAQRRSRFDVRQRLVNGVVGAYQEISADLRELVRRGKHQLAHAWPIVAIQAFHVLGKRGRVHRDLGMRVRAQQSRALHTDGPITQRRPFGGAGDNANVLGHDDKLRNVARQPLRSRTLP